MGACTQALCKRLSLHQKQTENMRAFNSIRMVKIEEMKFCQHPIQGLTPRPQCAPQPILGSLMVSIFQNIAVYMLQYVSNVVNFYFKKIKYLNVFKCLYSSVKT